MKHNKERKTGQTKGNKVHDKRRQIVREKEAKTGEGRGQNIGDAEKVTVTGKEAKKREAWRRDGIRGESKR